MARDDLPRMHSPTPEIRLLVDALAPRGGSRVDYRHWGPARWESALAAAEWHRVAPLLFRHLDRTPYVPTWVTARLEERYLANAARNIFVTDELRRVLAALAAVDIPVMPLKGAALIEMVYPDPALRELFDLDLLVPVDRLAEAEAILLESGYEDDPAAYGDEPSPRALRANDHHEAGLVHRTRVTAIELHRQITIAGEGKPFNVGEIWDRAEPSASQPTCMLPAPEDLLLHVTLHFTRNRLGGSAHLSLTGGALAQIADIAWLARGTNIDWDTFAATALEYGLGLRVFLALFAAAELGIEIPGRVLTMLRPAGFDAALGRQLVALRVLRTNRHLGVQSLRRALAPSRQVLTDEWQAGTRDWRSLTRAYVRRVRTRAPQIRYALRRPFAEIQDYRIAGQIRALEERS